MNEPTDLIKGYVKSLDTEHKFFMEEYLERPNKELDEFLNNLSEEEQFLLVLMLLDDIGGNKMHNYTEFDKLVKMLDDAKIPYERDDDDPNHYYYKRTGNAPVKRIKYGKFPGKEIGCTCSVICGYGTYGGDEGLLEIMGLLTSSEEEQDSVAGWLSAENVFNRIKNHYDSNKEAEE